MPDGTDSNRRTIVVVKNTDEARLLAEVGSQLQADYRDHPTADVQATIDECVTHFDGVRIRDYLPLLVERRARSILGSPS